jgi:hypothetical protein
MDARFAAITATAALLVACGPAAHTASPTVRPSQGASSTATPAPRSTAGSPSDATSTPTPATGASASLAPALVSVTGHLPSTCDGPAPPSSGGPVVAVMNGQELELINGTGGVLNTLSGVGTTSGPTVIGTSPDGVYLWNATTGALEELGISGAPVPLGTTVTSPALDLDYIPSLPVVSPNGRCWVLSIVTWSSDLSVATTQLDGGTFGSPSVQLATLTRSDNGGYPALGRDDAGVLLGSEPMGVGGGGPGADLVLTYQFSEVVVMNPSTGSLSAPLCAGAGAGTYQALSPDGELEVCRASGPAYAIEYGSLAGPLTTVDAGASAAGDAAITPDRSYVTYCTLGAAGADGSFPETLWSVQLGGSATPRSLMTQANWSECGGYGVGNDFAVTLAGSEQPDPVDLIELASGDTTTIGTADSIIGVL